MAARTVSVKLVAEVGSYVTGMKNAAAATKDLSKGVVDTIGKNQEAARTVGTSLLAMGTAVGIGVGLAVKKFADFDQAMSNVQAATHESAAGMDALREAALEAGAKTAFSATEAASAIEELAKAGVSSADILGGGLAGALDLAAAGSLGVGEAAEIAATALVQFGLDGAKVPHVADLLAAAAGKAQGSVGDMGAALKQVGLVANSTGLTIEETTAGLAAFASAGLIGSDAGTSFKSMLQRLNPQSDEAAALMEELGFSAYDAQGNFIGLEALAGELTTSFAGMSTEQRAAAMSTLFGSDAVRAATVLYDQGAAGIADWTAQVYDQGYAAETAAIKLDNLKGDLEALGGSFETALIGSGSAANGVLREMVQAVTAVINAYSSLPAGVQAGVLGVAAFTSAAGLAGGAALIIIPKIVEMQAALATLGVTATATSVALTALKFAAVGAIGVGVVAGVVALGNAFAENQPSVEAFTASIADFATTGEVTGAMVEAFGADFSGLASAMDTASTSKWFSLDWGTSQTDIIESREAIANLDGAMASLTSSGHPEMAEKQMRAIEEAAKAQGVSVEELRKMFPQYDAALTANAAEADINAAAQFGLDEAAVGATESVQTQTEALVENMATIREATGLVLGLRDASRQYEAAIDDATAALEKNGRTLDTTTEAGRNNEAALDGIASSANDVLEAMIANGEPLANVSAKLATQRERLIAAAESFGMTRQQAVAYTDSVLKIPTQAVTTVTTPGISAAQQAVQSFISAVNGIPSLKNVTVRYNEVLGTQVQRGSFAGRVVERASGGWVFGPGTGTSDSIDARLSNGEFVVNARSAAQNRALLEAVNGNRFANGGWAGGSPARSVNVTAAAPDMSAMSEGFAVLAEKFDRIERTVAALPREHQQANRKATAKT